MANIPKNIDEVVSNYLTDGFNSLNPNSLDDSGLSKNLLTDNEITQSAQQYNDKYLFKNIVPLNHVSFPYFLTRSSGNNTMPEVASLFLKTFLRKLDIPNIYDLLLNYNNPQTISNIPYPLATYLGSLNYFNNTEPIKYDKDRIFNMINNVSNVFVNRDIYNENSLKKQISSNVNEFDLTKFRLSNTRILNRSYFTPNLIVYNFDFGDGLKTRSISFKDNTFRTYAGQPVIGYGIQNNFIKEYHKLIFNSSLGDFDNKPFTIISGDLGILKPIKTYNSEIEFTAFYRSVTAGLGYDLQLNRLVEIFTSALTTIKNTNIDITNYNKNYPSLDKQITDLFLVYSKLKTAYLNGSISDDTLNSYISDLCDVNILGTKDISEINNFYSSINSNDVICDFYYIIAFVLFSSYKNVGLDPTKWTKSELTKNNIHKSVYQRFNKGALKLIDYTFLSETSLPTYLNKELFRVNTDAKTRLFNFFKVLWDPEKSNLDIKFNNLTSKSVFTLYPSAGGVFFPDTLINNKNISILHNNTPILPNSSGKINIPYSNLKDLHLFNNEQAAFNSAAVNDFFGVDLDLKNIQDSRLEQYLIPTSLTTQNELTIDTDESGFKKLLSFRFNNSTILKNTSRLLWFDPAYFGINLTDKLDYKTGSTKPSRDFVRFNIDYIEPTDMLEQRLVDNRYFNLIDLPLNGKINFGEYDTRLYKSFNTNLDNTTEEILKTEKTIVEQYLNQFKYNRLLDIVSIDNLDYFTNLFKDFSTIDKKPLDGFYNLKSLMMACTFLTSDELKPITINGLTYNSNDISLLLLGNHSYNYDFIAKSGIAAILNASLTLSQHSRFEQVSQEFLSMATPTLNFTNYGSVENKNGIHFNSSHNILTMPEVFFSNVTNFDEYLVKIRTQSPEITGEDLGKYFFRKVYFGDNYIDNYSDNFNSNEINSAVNKYVLDSNLILNKDLNMLDIFNKITIQFFKDINVLLTKDNIEYLVKPLRTYIIKILEDNKLLDTKYLYSGELVTLDDISKDFNNRLSEKIKKSQFNRPNRLPILPDGPSMGL